MTASKLTYAAVILAVVPFLLSCIFSRQQLLFISLGLAIDAILVLLLLVDWFMTQGKDKLVCSREVSERLSIGRSNKVSLTVFNSGAQDLRCRLRDDYPRTMEQSAQRFSFACPAGSQVDLHYMLRPNVRGQYKFGKINIAYLSALGFFWRQLSLTADKEVRVFSDLQALHELSIKLKCANEISEFSGRRRGQGTDFASLRDYAVGDDCRLIDWKATARRGRPIVRNFEVEQEQTLLCLVDAGRSMACDLEGLPRFEHALNAALCLAMTGLARNDQVGLAVFADKPLLYLPPRRGRAHFKNILESVATVETRSCEPDYGRLLAYFSSQQKGRALMVVLTDLADAEGSNSLLAGLMNLTPQHLPFCVALADKQIGEIAKARSANIDDVYRKAVATEMLWSRERVHASLTRKGCLVLDCPASELSTQLVNRYLEIKARGLL